MTTSGGRAFKAEDAAHAQALRQERAWHTPGALRRNAAGNRVNGKRGGRKRCLRAGQGPHSVG